MTFLRRKQTPSGEQSGHPGIVRGRLPARHASAYAHASPAPDGPFYVLGLGRTHCATACLLVDGQVVACVSEERFNRKKNSESFPAQAIEFVLGEAGIGVGDLHLAVYPYAGLDLLTRYRSLVAPSKWNPVTALANQVAFRVPALERPLQWAYYTLYHEVLPRLFQSSNPTMYSEPAAIGMPADIITAADHHTCHSYAAYFGFARDLRSRDTLILSHDAEGDGLGAVVATMRDDRFQRIATTPSRNSLATLYGLTTRYLGMKMNEHEYKLMGLAPYASAYEVAGVIPALQELIWLGEDGLTFRSRVGSGAYPLYLKERLDEKRFDGIAGALQRHTEDLVVRWTRAAVKHTGITRVALGGGLFMNVKANKAISEIPEVTALLPCPSASDESTAIGAAYWGYQQLCDAYGAEFHPAPIKSLYLGPDFADMHIQRAISAHGAGLHVETPTSIEKAVAKLLANGHIVARLSGRMEWGARALGNRSILANPSNTQAVRMLNQQIKSRDFWMPFAATILADRADEYLVNPKSVPASFMMIALDTTDLGRKQLPAALHPYDYTCRPQILERWQNGSYYDTIKAFESLTGIGAVLNTSFNLHGEPIVCSPEDALSTLLRSGLQYLAMGRYLIAKSSANDC